MSTAQVSHADPRAALLQDAFLKQAAGAPDASAVICRDRVFTYRETLRQAQAVAARLARAGAAPDARVAVAMTDGWQQLTAALGTWLAGMAYVPFDLSTGQAPLLAPAPATALAGWLTATRADVIVKPPGLVGLFEGSHPASIVHPQPGIDVDGGPPPKRAQGLARRTAYVIERSDLNGTAAPLAVTHGQATSAVAALVGGLRLDAQDRVISTAPPASEAFLLCALGALAAGGTIVIPTADELGDPMRGLELIDDYHVTIWSSPPAALQALLARAATTRAASVASLRHVLLLGRWLPVQVATEVVRLAPGARIASLQPVSEQPGTRPRPVEVRDPLWKSLPPRERGAAGLPRFYVLSDTLDDCPPLATGDLYIARSGVSGSGVARTGGPAAQLVHPRNGDVLLKTGYRARRRPDGGVDFDPFCERQVAGTPPPAPVWWARAAASS